MIYILKTKDDDSQEIRRAQIKQRKGTENNHSV